MRSSRRLFVNAAFAAIGILAAVSFGVRAGDPITAKDVVLLQERCMKDTVAVVNRLVRYQATAFQPEKERRDGEETRFQDLRSSLENVKARNPECYPYVFNAYATATVLVLHSNVIWSREAAFLDQSPDPAFRGLFMITAALAQHQVFRPLDAETRKSFGGIYEEKTDIDGASRSRVMGLYGCKDSAIWIDPDLRPLDFGAVMVHEIVHLYRDKFGNSDDEVVDELLSSLEGSWAQFRLQHDLNRAGTNNRRLSAKFGFLEGLDEDLRLFSKNGPLHSTWSQMVKDDGVAKSATLGSLIDRFKDERYLRRIQPAIDMIATAYRFDPKTANLDFDRTIGSSASDRDPISIAIGKINAKTRWAPGASVFSSGSFPEGWDDFIFPLFFDGRFPSEITNLLKAIESPSTACSRRIEDAKGVEGGRPGVEGGRPGVEGGRPCLRFSL